jgi:hypothetical protein
MADPITAAVIVGLAAQKFAEGAAGKGAEKLVEQLWGAIAARFQDRKKTAENLAAIEAAKGKDAGAIEKVTTVLDGELVEDDEFAAEVQQLAQQIINIQNQSQSQKTVTMTQTNQDQSKGYQVDADRIEHLGDRY